MMTVPFLLNTYAFYFLFLAHCLVLPLQFLVIAGIPAVICDVQQKAFSIHQEGWHLLQVTCRHP